MSLLEPSFESLAPWDTEGDGVQHLAIFPRTGTYDVGIRRSSGIGGGYPQSWIKQDRPSIPSVRYRASVWARELFGHPEDELRLEVLRTQGGDWEELAATAPGWGETYAKLDGGTFYARDAVTELRFRVPAGSTQSAARWLIDDAELEPLQEDLVGLSNVEQFLTNLETLVEGVDANIGPVLKAEHLWNSDDDLVDDGATYTINAEGLFDGAGMVDENVTRFWILEPLIQPSPMTTDTFEWRCEVNIVGFFGFKDDQSQLPSLRIAATKILEKLALKASELTDLAASMGAGYMGYLTEAPRWLEPPRGAQLAGNGAVGHLARLRVTYFEEVSRS